MHLGGSPAYGGTVTINAAGVAGPVGFTGLGGELEVDSAAALADAAVVVSGNRGIAFGAVNPVFGSLSGAGNIALTTTAGVSAGTLTVGGLNAATTYSGVLSGTAGLALTGGMLTLANTNTFTGNTTVSGGTLNVANAGALLNSTVNVSGTNAVTFSPSLAAATLGGLSGSGNLNLNNASLTIGNNGLATTYSGVLSGGSGLTKIGGGVLALTNSHSYAGPTSVQGGTLLLAGAARGASQTLSDIGIKLDSVTTITSRQARSRCPTGIFLQVPRPRGILRV